jgi:hypothetical protein
MTLGFARSKFSWLFLCLGVAGCKARTFGEVPGASKPQTELTALRMNERSDQGDFVLAISKTGNLYFGMFYAAKDSTVSLVPGFVVPKEKIGTSLDANELNSEFGFEGFDDTSKSKIGKKSGFMIRDFEASVALVNSKCELEMVAKGPLDSNRYKILGEDFLTFSDVNSGKRLLPKSLDADLDFAVGQKFGLDSPETPSLRSLKVERFEAETVLVGGEMVSFRTKSNDLVQGKFLIAQPGCILLEEASNQSNSKQKGTPPRNAFAFSAIQIETLRSRPLESDLAQNERDGTKWEGINNFLRSNNYQTQLNQSTFLGTRTLAQQGFKIYVAAAASSAQAVAQLVLPYLVKLGVRHQIRRDLDGFASDTSPESKGKLVTIFANNADEARIIAQEIDGQFKEKPVQFSKVDEYTIGGSGILSARFQAFTNAFGDRLESPDKKYPLAPERGSLKPDWINNPFEGL